MAQIGQIGRSWTRNKPGKSSKATGKKNKRIRTRSGRRRKTRHLLLLVEGTGIVVGRIGVSRGSASPLLGAAVLAALPLLPRQTRGHLHIIQGTLLAHARSRGRRPSGLRTRDRNQRRNDCRSTPRGLSIAGAGRGATSTRRRFRRGHRQSERTGNQGRCTSRCRRRHPGI